MAIVDSSIGCLRAIASETRSRRLPCNLGGRLRENLFAWRFSLRCDTDTRPWAKMLGTQVLGRAPRHSSASNGFAEWAIRTVGEQLRTLRHDAQKRYRTQAVPSSATWPRMVRNSGFCVTRYVRGAGGTTASRAAYVRDYTQEIVALAETILFMILASEHRGMSSGKRLQKSDTAWCNGIWLGKSETKHRARRDTVRRDGSENNPKTATIETLGNVFVAQETRSTLALGTECTASWATQETFNTWTSFTTSSRKPHGRQVRQFKSLVEFRSKRKLKLKLRPSPEVNRRQRWRRQFL